MKGKILKIKKIGLSVFLALALSTGCFLIYNSCYADEVSLTPYYEKITKQYPSMEEYIAQARKNVKNNWYPSSKSFEKSATIVLTLNKDGELLNSYISASSGDNSFDASLLEAAGKTKFLPLPQEVKENSVDIDMLFQMQKRNLLFGNKIQIQDN